MEEPNKIVEKTIFFFANATGLDIEKILIVAAEAQNLRSNYFVEKYKKNREYRESNYEALVITYGGMAKVSQKAFCDYIINKSCY